MSNIPADLRYTADHEYVKMVSKGLAQIGVQEKLTRLGDIVFVNPAQGRGQFR
jgi:glycine cleavage system H lipoate-binding protein